RYDWTLTGHAITDEPIAWPDEAAEYDAAAAAQAWMPDVCQESEGTLLGVIPLHYREAFGARTSGCTAAVVEIALLHSLSVTGDVIAWALAVDDGGWSGDFRGGAVQGNIAYVLTNATVREETDGFSPLVLPSFWSVGSPGGGGSYGVLDSAGSGNGPKILEVRAAGLDVNPTTWLDLSTELSEALWMIRDDDRECWWVWGLTAADDELCILHIDDSQVVEQVAVLPGESGLQVAACTRLSSGLWCAVAAKDDEPERILRYRYGASEFDIVLEKGSAVWPFVYPTGPTGRLWHYGVGAAFFVGSVETCDTTCVCLVEDNEVSTPWMDIGERIFPDPPYEDMNAGCGAGPAVPRPAACCGWTVSEEGWVPQFRNASCLFIFPYEITLCELRELAEIVVQGPVTAVRINDVPIASITDWSEVPLTGEISFRLGSSEVCGPKSGTVIITLIDSEGCCSRHTREVECCQCCPPSGGVSIASDVAESWAVAAGWAGDTSVFACDNTGGGDGCISGCRNYWEWYEMTFNAASLTDCGELADDDTRACYFIDWGGAEPRDGEILPGMMQPGGTVRFRVKLLTNDDSTPNPVCIRVWVGDALAAS
ncbi:MAG TPA: hypothetical protein PKC18_17440, partial [Lacipirellulaceae bacterium]|nr:hypothetical protein [Lacipirellulaceae bacterium]